MLLVDQRMLKRNDYKAKEAKRYCSYLWSYRQAATLFEWWRWLKAGKKKKGASPNNKPKIGKVKAKYDWEWFTGELVSYNKDIDQWTIYFKDNDYTNYVIFSRQTLKWNMTSFKQEIFIM